METKIVGTDVLLKALKSYIMKIEFIKKDGTVRVMHATINKHMQPEYNKKTDRTRNLPDNLISVVDVDLKEWRTINTDTIKSAVFMQPVNQLKN